MSNASDFLPDESDFVQLSGDGKTIWVHAQDGSTVGRFSKKFGMDVHTTAEEQMDGKSQCLNCTHQAPDQADWDQFCDLMLKHYNTKVDRSLMSFEDSDIPRECGLCEAG